jgi:hypothetical protein
MSLRFIESVAPLGLPGANGCDATHVPPGATRVAGSIDVISAPSDVDTARTRNCGWRAHGGSTG